MSRIWTTEEFQLPRIAKPSGTPVEVRRLAAGGDVSTSPDSKAIRNQEKPWAAARRASAMFQLPRIAKPSGTHQKGASSSANSSCFNFPG